MSIDGIYFNCFDIEIPIIQKKMDVIIIIFMKILKAENVSQKCYQIIFIVIAKIFFGKYITMLYKAI